jgi:hypothetical protein
MKDIEDMYALKELIKILCPGSDYALSMGEANRGKESMVFNWELAARIIVMKKPQTVRAGLKGDWDYTGGDIWRDGKPVPKEDTYVYLASTWAVPEIEVDGELIDCYLMRSEAPDWDAHTYWPPEALRIIENDSVWEGEIIETKLLTEGDKDGI